ncbi:DNA/RNA non-specific endonuclease [Nocardia asteroides]|uniref:WXG100-like domain-containing protein n=1 Tax=Nocardia asteroides TaxID=1824 RepID=UPI001E3FA42A|nr:DNA/RNA non-specific endonuclease [Nocardia asteroides]UGT58281.1 DNA/RNA non-specific endonuclease [Nocardia asteroides]
MGIEIPDSLQWVAKYILGAGDWPEGDETAMRRAADAWSAMAQTLDTVDDEAAKALNSALTALSEGVTHDAIAAYRDKLLAGDEAAFTAIRKWCEKQAELLDDGANDIEHTKLVIIGTMIVAAVEIGVALATAWTGIGAAAGVAARVAAQVAVRVAMKSLLTRMIARGIAKAAARAALRGAAFEALEEGGIDGIARTIQVAKGDRTMDEFGWSDLGLATFAGAVGGAVGGGLGNKLGGVGDDISSGVGKLAAKSATGAATELGADLSAQVAAASASSLLMGQDFNLDIGVDTFTSAGAGGVQSALESGGGNQNSPAPTVPELGDDAPGGDDAPTSPASTAAPSSEDPTSPATADAPASGDPTSPASTDAPGSGDPTSPASTDAPGSGDPTSPADTNAPSSEDPASPAGADAPDAGDPSSPASGNAPDAGDPATPAGTGTPEAGAPTAPAASGSPDTPDSPAGTGDPGSLSTGDSSPGANGAEAPADTGAPSAPDSGTPSDGSPASPLQPAANSPDTDSPAAPDSPADAGSPSTTTDAGSPSTPADTGNPSTPVAESPANSSPNTSPGSTPDTAAPNNPAPMPPDTPSDPGPTSPASPTNSTPGETAPAPAGAPTDSTPAATNPSAPSDTDPAAPTDSTPAPADPSTPTDTTPGTTPPPAANPSTPTNDPAQATTANPSAPSTETQGSPTNPATAPGTSMPGSTRPDPSTSSPSALDLPPVDTPATTPANPVASQPNSTPDTTAPTNSPADTNPTSNPATTVPGPTQQPATPVTPTTPAPSDTHRQNQPPEDAATKAAATTAPPAATPSPATPTVATPAPPVTNAPNSSIPPITTTPIGSVPPARSTPIGSRPPAMPTPADTVPSPGSVQSTPIGSTPPAATTPGSPPNQVATSSPQPSTGNQPSTVPRGQADLTSTARNDTSDHTPQQLRSETSPPADTSAPSSDIIVPTVTDQATPQSTPPTETRPASDTTLTPQQLDNATRARQARESLRPVPPANNEALQVNPMTGRPYLSASYPNALGEPVRVVRITAAVTGSPTTPPTTVDAVTDRAQLATDATFNQGNQFPLGDWLMVDVVPTTDPTTADLTIDADTDPTLTDLANSVRTNLGLSPATDPTLTSDDIHQLGSDISRADLARATVQPWADQHSAPATETAPDANTTPETGPTPETDATPETEATPDTDSTPETDATPDTEPSTDTTVDLDAIHNEFAENTPAGVSHHRGDPTMGDLPHRVPADPTRFTADTHITPDGQARIGPHTLTPEQYGDLLRRSGWDGVSPIRLIGCDASTNGFADRLAQHLGVEVLAPTQAAWTDANGNVFSTSATTNPDGTTSPRVPPDGQWQTHHPNGSVAPAGSDPNPPGTSRPTSYEDSRDTSAARSAFQRQGIPQNPYSDLAGNRPVENIGPTHPLSPRRNQPFGRVPGRRVRDAGTPIPLEPNTAYRVTDRAGRDRGLFITGPDGRIAEVVTNSGMSTPRGTAGEGFNPDLRHPLPDAVYTVDQKFIYSTDPQGRVVRAEGRLEHTGSDNHRRGPDQTPIGNDGPREYRRINSETVAEFKRLLGREPTPQEVFLFEIVSFNGGHLFGTEFDGPGEAINMVPMLELLNQSQPDTTPEDNWRRLEILWEDILSRQPPPTVNARIDLQYDPNDPASTAPRFLEVTYTVDGVQVPPFRYNNMPPRN